MVRERGSFLQDLYFFGEVLHANSRQVNLGQMVVQFSYSSHSSDSVRSWELSKIVASLSCESRRSGRRVLRYS